MPEGVILEQEEEEMLPCVRSLDTVEAQVKTQRF
jgi:hypothetical protein